MLGKLINKDVDENNWNWKKAHGDDRPTQDVLIVLSSNGTADIAPVVEINEERLLAYGEVEYAVPIADTKVYIGRRGRIFSYPASEENITDVKRIAALERSTVLRQITMYEKERFAPESKLPLGKIILIGLAVLVLIIIMVVKK
jgi:hypothetical protein